MRCMFAPEAEYAELAELIYVFSDLLWNHHRNHSGTVWCKRAPKAVVPDQFHRWFRHIFMILKTGSTGSAIWQWLGASEGNWPGQEAIAKRQVSLQGSRFDSAASEGNPLLAVRPAVSALQQGRIP